MLRFVLQWITHLETSLQEVEWVINKKKPTLEEYLSNGIHSCGAGIYFINFFYLGPNFSSNVLETKEYESLLRLAGRLSRMFNDYASIEVYIYIYMYICMHITLAH